MKKPYACRRGPAAAAATVSFTLIATLACAGGPPPEATDPAGADPDAAAAPADTAVGETAGSFTAAQVQRGREEFEATCAECHSTGDFRGRDFLFRWRRQSAWDFYRNVTSTMPEDAPGSLSDRQYVDIIAYILELNGYAPRDSELPAEREALEKFAMDGAGDE